MQDLSDWIAKLNASGVTILVEGKKDIYALRKVGVKNSIFTLGKKPLFKVAEDFPEKDAVILTDFDKKGKELYGRLNTELQQCGVRIDKRFREWLQRNLKISHIEGLDKLDAI